MSNELTFWEDKTNLDSVKKIYGANLSVSEWNTFLEIGKASGLNPFLKEIWAVKYGSSAAQIFIGRDGYRIFAVQSKDYDGHIVSSIYSNDSLSINDGKVSHEYKLSNRGNLIGAICTVYKKSTSVPVYVSVELSEYNTKRSVWGDKPETMIKKVAEAQALRMAFPKKFNGTYSEYEIWDESQKAPGMKIVKEETLVSKEYASKADEIAASMGDHVEQIIIHHEPKKEYTLDWMIDRLVELGADYSEIMKVCGVEFIDDINDSHRKILIEMGKKLNPPASME